MGELTKRRPLCGSRGAPQIRRLRSPGFLLRFVALMHFMRLSLRHHQAGGFCSTVPVTFFPGTTPFPSTTVTNWSAVIFLKCSTAPLAQ